MNRYQEIIESKRSRERDIERIKEKFFGKIAHYKEKNSKEIRSLGKLIREFREEKRWSRRNLADILGVSHHTIRAWEMEKYVPRNEYLLRLSTLFNYPFKNFSRGRHVMIVATNLPPKEYEVFHTQCKAIGINKSEFLRECIRVFFDTRG